MEETQMALSRLDWSVAAGPDEVGGGLLRLLAETKVEGRELANTDQTKEWIRILTALAWNIFVREGRLRVMWDTVTKPLWKKDGSREMKNLRPIALQNSIAKIPSSILARRLMECLNESGTMHYAQEAFLRGGRAENVVWTAINIWSDRQREGKPYYSVMYDWKKAY